MRPSFELWLMCTIVLCVLAFGWFEWVAINNWLVGRWYLADVGNVQAMLVNTLHGNFMYSPLARGQHYAYHFTPMLTLLAPITLLSKYPIPLITTYNIALALCPLPLYRLARQQNLPGAAAFAMGVLFVGNHFVGSIQLAYHFESYYLFFALLVMALFQYGKPLSFWLSVAAALSVKEDAAAWLAAFAGYAAWVHWPTARRTRALRLLAVCVVYGVAAGLVMWVSASQQSGSALSYVKRAGGIAIDLDIFKILGLLVASVGGLCLLGGRSLLLILVPAPLLLSQFEMTRELRYYYSYPFLPFLFYAAVVGAGRLSAWLSTRAPRLRPALAFTLLVLGGAQAFLPTRTDGYRRWPAEVTPRHLYRIDVAARSIPPQARVIIQFGLWGITPSRPHAYDLQPEFITPASYIFLDLKAPYGMPPAEYLALVRPLFAEVEAGMRPLLHGRDEIYVIGPAD